MNAKLGSADVIARRIERALNRFYPTSLVQLVRLPGLLVYLIDRGKTCPPSQLSLKSYNGCHFSLTFDQPLFFLASLNLTIAAFAWRLFDTQRYASRSHPGMGPKLWEPPSKS